MPNLEFRIYGETPREFFISIIKISERTLNAKLKKAHTNNSLIISVDFFNKYISTN